MGDTSSTPDDCRRMGVDAKAGWQTPEIFGTEDEEREEFLLKVIVLDPKVRFGSRYSSVQSSSSSSDY